MSANPADWCIRKAGLEDLEQVVRLRLALMCELHAPAPGELDAWASATRRYLMSALPSGRFHVWLAFAGDEAVSCGGLSPFERPPAPGNLSGLEGYILNMYTVPTWRKRGVSRALLADLMAFARELGMGRLWLHASDDGRSLYESVGFAPNLTALEWTPGP
ncbi:GNAT family N-acetyltransferase [Myxococcus stipitatus]|uniref:GNAT family N-acetyltransferase n=1 Tax=Myxococcus stipitatus TaxID=83455 RepID=UPI0030D59C96